MSSGAASCGGVGWGGILRHIRYSFFFFSRIGCPFLCWYRNHPFGLLFVLTFLGVCCRCVFFVAQIIASSLASEFCELLGLRFLLRRQKPSGLHFLFGWTPTLAYTASITSELSPAPPTRSACLHMVELSICLPGPRIQPTSTPPTSAWIHLI